MSPAQLHSLMRLLAADTARKQGVLETLQAGTLRDQAGAQIALWRVRDAEGRTAALSRDVAQLRRLLQDERQLHKVRGLVRLGPAERAAVAHTGKGGHCEPLTMGTLRQAG